MNTLSRRHFMKVSGTAFGAVTIGSPIFARSRMDAPVIPGHAKIYTVFFSSAPSIDDTDLRPLTHEEIIRKLQQLCQGVDYIVRDSTKGVSLNSILNEMQDLKQQQYDGVLIFGKPRDNIMLQTGLPTINAAILNDFMTISFPLFQKNKVVPAMIDPWKFCTDTTVTEAMYQDLTEKIQLIKALKMMKERKLLTVTNSRHINVIYNDMRKNPPLGYNEILMDAIDQSFGGTTVAKIGTKEVASDAYIRDLWKSNSKEANDIARMWINDAVKMINTIESEVVRAAKVYLAMKHLMQKYEADAMAFHIRSLIENPRAEDTCHPALATSEFQKTGKIAKCQSHINIVLTDMLAQYAFGRPSMFGDFSVDPFNGTSITQHCEGPWNPWGDERRVPYIITDHRERRVRTPRSRTGVGAGSWILYPGGEPATVWQIDVMRKEILLHTGTTVPMLNEEAVYKDHFYEMM